MTQAELEAPAQPRKEGLVRRIVGRTEYFDFIGKSRTFLLVTLALLALVIVGGLLRGLNFSIEFTGGSSLTVLGATKDFTVEQLTDAVADAGIEGAIVQVVDDGDGALINTPAVDRIGGEQQRAAIAAIAETTGVAEEDIAVDAVGPRWGERITRQALRALLVFLVLVALYLALRFEWRMAAAAIVTLLHDIILTVGIYAIVGFPVSPASVIAFLTILGYSLYDTVVVFDRVGEDTEKLSSVSTQTYGEAANDALNEVLVRSLSTSITSLLPVGSLLFVGATLLGAETLQDLALALFIGMAVGTYSSVVVATPFLVWLKEKEPRWAELKERVESRRRGPAAAPAPVPAPAAAAAGTGTSGAATPAAPATRSGGKGSGARKSAKSPKRRR
jgi:preprotein translocase subunit SecF